MKITCNQIKVGNIINHKGKLWRTVKIQHTQPGKGGAYLQVELKDIAEGTKLNERFRTSETIEKIRLEEREYQYLYNDDFGYHFMDNENYEQIILDYKIINDLQKKFLKENSLVKIESYEEKQVSIKLPDTISLEVIETESVVKGQTASSSFKPAILENNVKASVPPHISAGDKVIINTNDGSYVEKAKQL
ncbi:MAG: Elongation factor P [Alphaproteobacteria bacterium MarineAlpha5_Bin11]|nr:elongation factor P [Pelagibacteraceae bacterium]PPR43852.1 MAG: Elongation factor P [Alphaproteobacteria bacterium MarineAlpha5_Bin11]|tara:strand:- start:7523 stop:8095 length:573 start_codon:yes stop_codon:yes gene_type:complete